MKTPRVAVLAAALLATLSGGLAGADDGQLLRKSMSKAAGDPGTVPVSEAEHAFIDMMKFYVTAQASNGAVTAIDYYNADGALITNSMYAKPLIGVYIYGPVEGVEGVGFVGHGKRDAYAAVSLDDGTTWKRTNLSESASETSSEVIRTDIALFADTAGEYPGDVINVYHAVAGQYVLVAWPSRFCSSGKPNYSMVTSDPARRDAVAAALGIDLATPSPDDLYLLDMYGVAGQQGSVDYSEDDFEQNRPVGEVPFSCLWAARGVLVNGDDPRTADVAEASYLRWFKAERLTSGRRDVNRIEAECVAGAGCAITWQEDPEGLRPGQGEGPGEGWSGAIANSQTDVWYSYIPWTQFDKVAGTTTEGAPVVLSFADWLLTGDTTKPQVGIPLAMPMRVTDNARCNVANPLPYCHGSSTDLPPLEEGELNPLDYGLKDMCQTTVEIPTGPQGKLSKICVTEDGLPLVGNIAATRPRLALHGYASVQNPFAPIDSAFVVFVTEESKGLGAFGYTSDGTPCDPDTEGCVAFDEGKNIWYHTFSMSLTDSYAANEKDGLLANLAGHGNQLNQPEVDWTTGAFYPVRNTAEMWNFGDYNFEIWNTEIARRGSLLTQDITKVNRITSKARAGLIALPTWKQGVMNQGGPADVMSRRIIIPTGWTPIRGNPYAFRNMECSNWLYQDGSNPHYPDGLCMDSAINLSATVPDTCQDSETGALIACPSVNLALGTPFGIGDTNPILQGVVQGEGNKTKVLTWHQCPASFTTVAGTTMTCANDWRPDASTLADQSWYNPLDVAKGHRGFLDGDFVMMLYAWSPNWRTNAVGNDRYELYIRRSFDGGQTWTTLPAGYRHWDGVAYNGAGTTTCETFRSSQTQASGDLIEPRVCNQYAAGAAEQARNVTQLKSMRTTTLDPRYSATLASITDDPFGSMFTTDGDVRDPSRYFIVYETGDNTTTALGEPEPEDLFYSRAVMFGDNYQVWAEETDLSVCYPSDPHGLEVPVELVGSGFCNEYDQLDQGRPGLSASEASLAANSGGEFMYAAWAQWAHDETTGELSESDAVARRVWWIDGYIPSDAWVFGQGGGDGTPANP